jgi:hypothetical protein
MYLRKTLHTHTLAVTSATMIMHTTFHCVGDITYMQKNLYPLQKIAHHPVTQKVAETSTLDTSKRIDFFNNNKTHPEASSYDQTFRFQTGYNPKLKREDMQYTQVRLKLLVIGALAFIFKYIICCATVI